MTEMRLDSFSKNSRPNWLTVSY